MTTRLRPRWLTGWRVSLVALGVASGLIYLWGIGAGARSEFYAATAVSMSQSPANFFFGALDPAGTITLDKIPGSYWVPAMFVKVFGFSTWAVDAPNGLATVGAVLIVALAVRRLAGQIAGIMAAAFVAFTPIVAAVARSNQPQSFFLLTLAGVLYFGIRAVSEKSRRHLVWAGVLIGLGFQTYMLEAWAVWPALILAYLFTRSGWGRKLVDLIIAGGVSLAVSLAWIVVVWLVPASHRPYIGGTNSNSPWEMVFGYNGLGRFGQSSQPDTYRSFTPPFSGGPSPVRFFSEALAGQIAWLIPTSIVALVLLMVLRFKWRVTVFLGSWLAILYVMFAAVAGMHQFYVSAMAIPMAALIATAFVVVGRRGWVWAQVLLVMTAGVTAMWLSTLYAGFLTWVPFVQFALGLITALIVLIRSPRTRIGRVGTAVLAAAGMMLTPVAWSIDAIGRGNALNPVAGTYNSTGGQPGGQRGSGQLPGGTGPGNGGPGNGGPGGNAGPGAQMADPTLLAYLEKHRGSARYLLATIGAMAAAPFITATGEPIVPVGGFDGSDPAPTLAEFTKLIDSGELRYVLLTGFGPQAVTSGSRLTVTNDLGLKDPARNAGSGGPPPARSDIQSKPSSLITQWVTAHCSLDAAAPATGGSLYNCSAPKV